MKLMQWPALATHPGASVGVWRAARAHSFNGCVIDFSDQAGAIEPSLPVRALIEDAYGDLSSG
jgi:hypothetical protein